MQALVIQQLGWIIVSWRSLLTSFVKWLADSTHKCLQECTKVVPSNKILCGADRLIDTPAAESCLCMFMVKEGLNYQTIKS